MKESGTVMNKDLISIIVPVYNVEPYLKECLESILKQSYERLEIILVDDGSTDGSGRICDAYGARDKRITVIHKENGGVADARNIGLKHIHGDYVGFVDGDDWVDPDMFLTLYTALIRNKCEIAACNFNMAYKNRCSIYENQCSYKDGECRMNKREAISLLLDDKKCPSYLWNKLYKKEIIQDIPFPLGRTYEDVAVIHLIFEKAKNIVFIQKPLYYYRQRDNSIIHMKNMTGTFDCLEALAGRYRYYESDSTFRTRISRHMLKVICYGTDHLNSFELSKTERKEMLRILKDYYNLYCKKQTKRISKHNIRRKLYSDFPHIVKYWRSLAKPFLERIKISEKQQENI